MRNKRFVLVLLMIVVPLITSAQVITKLTIGSTSVSQGVIKFGEPLVTREGSEIPSGEYRISVLINSRGEGQYALSPFKLDTPHQERKTALEGKTLKSPKDDPYKDSTFIATSVVKNSLVGGIASNIEGEFALDNISPSEAMLSFSSKQLQTKTILGRSPNAKTVDLTPVFVGLEASTSCGDSCIEGNVKVVIRNYGNAVARGKWNVVLLEPQFYVGSVTEIPAGGEKEVISGNKLKMHCCGSVPIDAEVHPDFYNKDGTDSLDSNNTRRFSLQVQK